MLLLVRYLVLGLRALFAKRRLDLALENVALRHQLEVLARSRKRAPLRPAGRLLWSWLARLWPRWRRHLVIVQPETVVRWHRTAWRGYWTWKSGTRRPGRPRIDDELAELIRQMSEENPRWGHMRVLGELRKLGFRVSLQTVRRYRHRPRSQRDRAPARLPDGIMAPDSGGLSPIPQQSKRWLRCSARYRRNSRSSGQTSGPPRATDGWTECW